MLNSNKKPKVPGISYETDLIKNEDKDNVKCYTPLQQPKSTIHSGSRAERERVQLCGSGVTSYSVFSQYLFANWEALSLQTHISVFITLHQSHYRLCSLAVSVGKI